MRLASINIAPQHKTMRDVKIDGYLVPANSFVVTHLYGHHRDPSYWKTPHVFNIENFYNEANNSVINTNFLIPFSLGIDFLAFLTFE